MKTYLITGGAGFIGSNFIHYLKTSYGDDVNIINLDALTYCADRSNVSIYEKGPGYTFVQGDICDEALVQRLFAENNIDYVVHFAAQSHVDRSIEAAKVFVETNVCGTLTLLDAALQAWSSRQKKALGEATLVDHNERFLYVSTDEVYGELPEGGYFTEDTPLSPRNPYSASKASADMLARAYYQTHQLPVLVTRCSNNYGPYQYEEKFIPLCIKCSLSGEAIPLYGDGENIRDWLYVEDHCRAIELVLHEGKPGEVYNVGGHNEYTNRELIELLLSILKEEYGIQPVPIRSVPDRKGHDRRYAIDPAKMQAELGWEPETDFHTGIRRAIKWYMEHQAFLGL